MSRRVALELAQLALFSIVLSALMAPALVLGRGVDLASCPGLSLQAFPALALGLFVALGLADIVSSARR